MDNINYFVNHKKECKENLDYTRSILKQHMWILGEDIEKIVELYKHIKIELDALLEEEVKMNEGEE